MSDVNVEAKQIETMSGANFTCARVGAFDQLSDYEFTMMNKTFRGKVFLKECAGLSGMEISFTTIPPGKHTPFVHHHKQDEEAYIFIQGSGRMEVDDSIMDVSQGTVVRVAPSGKRAIGNNSGEPLIYICIQAKEGSLEQYTFEDGVKDDVRPKV